jgi:hypothetical protein
MKQYILKDINLEPGVRKKLFHFSGDILISQEVLN